MHISKKSRIFAPLKRKNVHMEKRDLSFGQLFNLSFGFFGVQIAYALQSANISRIFATLGADPHQLSFFWILPPLMGMIVQPLIGILSDPVPGSVSSSAAVSSICLSVP